ncbi:MAG: bifunctional adenosylcobinamide kinase/adenosylcobinamide-phosphate guanylyltransferase [Eubacteriales bacterium]|nr:bifunctional adenosylcobinamide kinase/adenosylcobinamide-phosphate guanylyltransferase [Eubacteriales bacterium]
MNIFISGGCKNGKSMRAQELARDVSIEQSVPLYYIATMIPADDEDRLRIKRHLQARDGWGFETVEQPLDLCGLLDKPGVDPKGAFLLDSVTALLSNEMFRYDGTYDKDAGKRVADDLVRFAESTGNSVFVSDYIYSDARIFDDYTENYRRSLAYCDRALAKVCPSVIETSFGNFKELKLGRA